MKRNEAIALTCLFFVLPLENLWFDQKPLRTLNTLVFRTLMCVPLQKEICLSMPRPTVLAIVNLKVRANYMV